MSTAELPGQQIQPPSRIDLRDGGVTTTGRHPVRNNGMISGTQITPLRRADIPELSQFLINDPATSYRFCHDVLLWKYFDGPSGPSEISGSSLIARSAGKIIGHIGMCPRQFIVSGDGATPVSTMHAIDWRASDAHPGLGALLMLKAFATSKTQYAIGGTELAEGIFPRLGFEQKRKHAINYKVLMPFRRLRSTRGVRFATNCRLADSLTRRRLRFLSLEPLKNTAERSTSISE
jgi:hypothetical protein